VDLIYLDPPFNSKATYNMLFQEKNGTSSRAQITAFEDTWHWGQESEQAYHEIVTQAPRRLVDLVNAIRSFLGSNDMMAYLVMMAVRLREMHRVLTPTGSLYLHCDPTASHYLKIVMDALFGAVNHRTEIIWKRSSAHSDAKQGRIQHGRIHDTILFYTKTDKWIWNQLYTPYDKEYVDAFYKYIEVPSGRRYQTGDLTAAKPGGDTKYEWRVKRPADNGEWKSDLTDEWQTPKEGWEYKGVPPYRGRSWAYSRANMIEYANAGRLCYTGTGMPRYKRYLDEMPGVPLQDIWTDIRPISAQAAERLGYPTQKPEALLERIIKASSNEGDVVLDPFCGCGTTIAVAEKLNRRWMGIDITHLAITLMKNRLEGTFGEELSPYEVIGDPKDLPSAKALAEHDRYQFECWALGKVAARPGQDKKKGSDSGIDGCIYFMDDRSGAAKKIVIQVKSGHVNRGQVATLRGDMEREKAVIGAFITLQEPTRPMKEEAAGVGFYEPEHFGKKRYPRLQILTVEDLLNGKQIDYPRVAPEHTFKQPERKRKGQDTQEALF